MNYIQQRMTIIFNEWAKRYSESPEEFKDVLDIDGKPSKDYGECCTLYFEKIADELDKAGLLPTTES